MNTFTISGQIDNAEIDAPKHYLLARSYLGITEIAGPKNNSVIVSFFKTLFYNEPDETPWCSSFVGHCLEVCKIISTKKLDARSYLKWGKPVAQPICGDVVVFWRGSPEGWQGHVAFFVLDTATDVLVLGGNQGNKVSYEWYPKKRILSYRAAI
jgi:uncharacterized protein (TIGR02594 family)